MIPILFKFGPFSVKSYGLMLATGFLVSFFLLERELRRRHLPVEKASSIIFWAMALGIAGSKLADLLENWSDFIHAPLSSIFSSGGLTWHGGLLLAGGGLIYLFHRWKVPIWTMTDAVAPMLALGYGFGRIGCQLAGDGDYGCPSDLPWAMAYPDGIVPTLQRVHPTPVYEALLMALLFAFLWSIRTRPMRPGRLFAIYLVLAGLERLMIEFIRINPVLLFGLTEAQLVAVGMMVAGAAGWWWTRSPSDT